MITSYKSLENRFSNYLLLPTDLYDSAWVNDVTELRGGNVDINVGGKTTVTGAVIAANADGELNLTTNELEYNDIHDFNTNHNNGVGLNTGFGIGTNKGESTLHPEKTTDVTIVHKGHDTEQTTHATIGAGNITVGDDTNPELAGLNRDTDNVQEITKDEITGALDSSVTVDNRVFSGAGREQIAKQHEDFIDNAKVVSVAPVTAVGAATALTGLITNPLQSEIYTTEKGIHVVGNPISLITDKSSPINLGGIIIYPIGYHPDDVGPIYRTSDGNIIAGYHEEAHTDQWFKLGSIGFLKEWVSSGGRANGNKNPLETSTPYSANEKAIERIKNEGLWNKFNPINDKTKKAGIYEIPKGTENDKK